MNKEDRDRLIWQALTLAADAILSLQCVQDQLNELLRTFEFAEMKPTSNLKSKGNLKRKTA